MILEVRSASTGSSLGNQRPSRKTDAAGEDWSLNAEQTKVKLVNVGSGVLVTQTLMPLVNMAMPLLQFQSLYRCLQAEQAEAWFQCEAKQCHHVDIEDTCARSTDAISGQCSLYVRQAT